MSKINIDEITKLNYEAQLRRGQIREGTNEIGFMKKIQEEFDELTAHLLNRWEIDPKELADLTLVCFSMAQHFGIDLVEEMRNKAEYNMIRED